MDYVFNIVGLRLRLAGCQWTESTMPRNFAPFLSVEAPGENPAVTLEIKTSASERPVQGGGEPLSVACNDLGTTALYADGDSWLIALTPCPGEAPRHMEMSRTYTAATLWLNGPADPFATFVIDSMTRIFFSQYAASRNALILHASVVVCDGRAFMFMGKSGTGKSTHSRLWLENFPSCTLLNDDCPMIIAGDDDTFLACGTPWSGKTPCWRDLRFPLGGIARLRQAPVNRFIPLAGIDSFVALIPGMSVMTSDERLYSDASSTVLRLVSAVPTGILECLPDGVAARLCREALTSGLNWKKR